MVKLLVPLALAAALALAGDVSVAPAGRSGPQAECARSSTGLVPLTDFGRRRYRGQRGGLYPNARNRPSPGYLRKGLAASRQVQPIDGKIVLLSIGMSNATQEFSVFKRLADKDPGKNPDVAIVDGAQGGWDAHKVASRGAAYWQSVDERLAAAAASPLQVQAVWLKEAIAGENRAFPRDARKLQADLRTIVRAMRSRYPNLRLVYLSSRTYGGYAITGLNPEPYAYESGFAVRWLIQERMRGKGKLRGPWVGWGPYLWTDGLRGRSDGLTWACEDVQEDGTHPSRTGAQKVANLLQSFFENDPTARTWFLAGTV